MVVFSLWVGPTVLVTIKVIVGIKLRNVCRFSYFLSLTIDKYIPVYKTEFVSSKYYIPAIFDGCGQMQFIFSRLKCADNSIDDQCIALCTKDYYSQYSSRPAVQHFLDIIYSHISVDDEVVNSETEIERETKIFEYL